MKSRQNSWTLRLAAAAAGLAVAGTGAFVARAQPAGNTPPPNTPAANAPVANAPAANAPAANAPAAEVPKAAAAKPKRAPRVVVPPFDPAKLAPIVGDTGQWTYAERFPGTGQMQEADGKPVFALERGTASLTSTTAFETDSEVLVRFRFLPQPTGQISLGVQTAIADAADTKDRGLYLTIGNKADPMAVNWSTANLLTGPGQKATRGGSYRVGFNAARSLGWPEAIRRLIEADMAAAETVAEHWFTLRIALRPEKAEFSLDGIPLAMSTKEGLKTSGFVRLTLGPNMQIASVAVRKLAPEDGLAQFQPVDLSSVVNSSTIDGKKVAPPATGSTKVGAVPFALPSASARGHNHVDVGASWLRQGSLEGRFSGDRDAFGGRWAGALERDPARIQLRVPKGRYKMLHLLAVADSEPDSVPVVTAQFFKNSAGFPANFVSPRVPGSNGVATLDNTIPAGPNNLIVPTQNNPEKVKVGDSTLYHIKVPLDPAALAAFENQDYFDLELTKQVQIYRAYPDPLFYSIHGAGLPSSVHVFAATLERPAVEVELKPTAYAHVWTAPQQPGYTVQLHNRSGAARPVEVTLSTASYWGNKTTQQKQTVKLGAPGEKTTATFKLTPPSYGYHDVTLTVDDGVRIWDEKVSLAYLHEDTRKRGDWAFGRGPMFGFWNWAGGHGTPNLEKQLTVMGAAGAETTHHSFYNPGHHDEAGLAVAERYKMRTYHFAGSGDHYYTGTFAGELKTKGLEIASKNFLDTIRKRQAPVDKLNLPTYLSFYAEPSIGPYTHAAMPDYYGEPSPKFSPAEEERFQSFLNGFIEGAKVAKANFPGIKTMLPYGDPNFPTPFLRRSPEAVKLIDGVSVDIPAFERLPEQQMHQVSIHRMYMSRNEFRKAGIEKPEYAMFEGPCVPSGPGALSQRELADLSIRNSLILLGYGVDFQSGGFGGFDTSSYWGEQHYGGGILTRMPTERPKPAFAAFATLTRNLNRSNFDGWTPTGSLTVFAQRYKHYQTGKLTHVMWTLRGQRPVTIKVPADAKVSVTDAMDNATTPPVQNGQISITLDSSPRYIAGLPADPAITLGDPDHSDAQPAANKLKLANLGDGSWKPSEARDTEYEQSHFPYIVRFQGKMSFAPTTAPAEQGGKALGVHLEKQEKERVIMPFYSSLVPARPIPIPGKASHLGMWVKASSDWGRVIYFVRDAKGEQWISVGKKGAWNCDDLHSWSSFNFDGWRYLRFEMPSNSPYDSYRELGSTWWGSYSSGDNLIDLPLSLEKVVVERRTHAMHVNDPQPASPDDVLLGDLFAEYASPQDQTNEPIRLATLRMPVPAGVPELGNPVAKMAETGVGAPVKITGITLPEQAADGTQAYLHFEKHPDAVTYDVWASPYPDGQGALQVGKAWKEPGAMARGFRPDTDFYLFVTYTDKAGKISKPSAPFKINLKDLFAQK